MDSEEMELRVAQGSLLAAGPDMLDPNFMHSVVLVCQHSPEGAYGLVVNRPAQITTRDVLSEHPVLGQVDAPLLIGGPVGLDTLQVLHRVPDRVPGGVQIAEKLWLGGDLDALGAYLRDEADAHEHVRMLMGYSGWGARQLEVELATGSWLPAPGDATSVFRSDAENLWRDVVRSLGASASGLEDQPPDPEWN